MQKKKKVAKAKAKAVKTTKSKNAKSTPVVKKVAKKVAAKKSSKKTVAVKAQATTAPKVKANPAKAAAPVYVPGVDFKSLSPEAQEQYKRWLKLQKQLAEEKVQDYKMTEDFELKTPISHKVHGWGVVLQKRDNYIDVLFETGLKTLIVNYKP